MRGATRKILMGFLVVFMVFLIALTSVTTVTAQDGWGTLKTGDEMQWQSEKFGTVKMKVLNVEGETISLELNEGGSIDTLIIAASEGVSSGKMQDIAPNLIAVENSGDYDFTTTTYDFEIGEYNTKLGTFLGFPGVGFEYTDGIKNAFVSVNEVAGNGYIQTRVTDGAGSVANTNTTPTSFAARAQNGAENSEIQITKDNLRLRHDSADFVNIADAAMTFDVASGDLFVNEGTTATGTNTALAGDALILQDPSTGEVKYGPAASHSSARQ